MVHLEFQREILTDLLAYNALLVMGKGLGMFHIVKRVVRAYLPTEAPTDSNSNELVLILGGSKAEVEWVLQQFRGTIATRTTASSDNMGTDDDSQGTGGSRAFRPQHITAEVPRPKRIDLYAEGGVLFISGRIAVIDLLTNVLRPSQVSGLVVLHAHTVTETSAAAFVTRILRAGNQSCFIKAISEHAESFLGGWGRAEKVMKALFLEKLLLWPRFHAHIAETLELHPPTVIELHQPLSPYMEAIQGAILDAINACVQELQQSKKIDTSDLTPDNALMKSFDSIIRRQLDPIWHTLGAKTRQLVQDLSTLRKLLTYLVRYDCVSFEIFLRSLQSFDGVIGQHSPWLFMDAAQKLFRLSKARVYRKKKSNPKGKPAATEGGAANTSDENPYELILDPNPKWELFLEVLEEICTEHASSSNTRRNTGTGSGGGVDDEAGTTAHSNGYTGIILVAVKDDRAAQTLQYCLEHGVRGFLLNRLYSHYGPEGSAHQQVFQAQLDLNRQERNPFMGREGLGNQGYSNRKRTRQGTYRGASGSNESSDRQRGASGVSKGAISKAERDFVMRMVEKEGILQAQGQANNSAQTRFNATRMTERGLKIMFHVLGSEMEVLHKYHPTFVIIHDPDPSFVRDIELYQALHPTRVALKVYFLMYKEPSVEHRKYVKALTVENQAFEDLIRTKKNMSVVDHQHQDLAAVANPSATPGLIPSSSRQPSVTLALQEKCVIVDIREFRSALPNLLHKEGVKVIPVTLEVGDYILTPEICVERKSIPDLFGSMASGRLYQQAENMIRHYSTPILLIEFDEARSFSFQHAEALSDRVSPQSIITKLAVLLLHFPSLRILWCRSPRMTTHVFQTLQNNRRQPDVEAAVSKGVDVVIEDSVSFGVTPMDCLARIPGVTGYNRSLLASKASNLFELSSLSLESLVQLIGQVNGTKVYNFFNS